MSRKSMFCKEYFWQILVTIGGLFVIFVTLLIGAFLIYKGPACKQEFGYIFKISSYSRRVSWQCKLCTHG